MAVAPREPSIEREQRRSKGFGEREVGGVVGGDRLAQLPDARQMDVVGVTRKIEGAERLQRLRAPCRIDVPFAYEAAEHVRHFEVHKVRRVQRLARRPDAAGNVPPGRRAQQ